MTIGNRKDKNQNCADFYNRLKVGIVYTISFTYLIRIFFNLEKVCVAFWGSMYV